MNSSLDLWLYFFYYTNDYGQNSIYKRKMKEQIKKNIKESCKRNTLKHAEKRFICR